MVDSAWTAVTVTVPDRKIVALFPTIDTMVILELSYENAPGLVETGCGMANVPKLEYVLGLIVKLIDGIALLIINVACMVADV